MPIYNSSPENANDRWGKIRNRFEVLGTCLKCRKHLYALVTIFANGETIVRCSNDNCKAVNQFSPDDMDYYNSALNWKPLGNDDEEGDDRGSGRYTRGRRD